MKEGHVKRVTDEDIQGTVLELAAANIANVSISCPADPTKTLGAHRRAEHVAQSATMVSTVACNRLLDSHHGSVHHS